MIAVSVEKVSVDVTKIKTITVSFSKMYTIITLNLPVIVGLEGSSLVETQIFGLVV